MTEHLKPTFDSDRGTWTRRRGLRKVALGAGIVALAALGAAEANAQQLLLTRQNITYTQLPSPTILTTDAVHDDTVWTVNLPFPIQYYNNSYTAMTVSANGAILFPGGQTISFSNAALGPATPNNLVAPFWDDLYHTNAVPGALIGHQVQGTAPNRTFTVEWRYTQRCCAVNNSHNFMVRFYEGPATRVEVDYGPSSGVAATSGTMGMEDANGANIFRFSLAQCDPNCTMADLGAVANTRVIVGASPNPELTGSFGTWPRGGLPGQAVTGQVVLTNLGTATATTVLANLYLSTDNTLDAGDELVGSVTSDMPNGNTTVNATVNVPANIPAGDYFLIMRVDANDRYVEINESNNIVVATQAFATAHDMSPGTVAVTNVGGVNAGDNVNFQFQVRHLGAPYAGPLEVALVVSQDQLFDANDPQIAVVTVNLQGNSNIETLTAAGVMPQLTPGSYYPIVRLDPNNAITETNENNNVAVGGTPFSTGPDFVVGALTVPGSVQPGGQATIVTRIDSVAVPFTGNVSYRLWASLDQTLSPSTDTQLGTFTVQLTGQPQLADSRDVTFPANMAVGYYYVIAEVDPAGQINEVSETNNTRVSATTIVNALDFSVTTVAATPAQLEVGQNLTVSATARSLGLPFTGNLGYRVYLSANNSFDLGDQPIYEGNVFLAGGATTPINATFPLRALPGDPQLVPGTYYVVVQVDPANTHPEALEDNNTAVTTGTVRIIGADLLVRRISAPAVAFMGMPIDIELVLANTGQAGARNFVYGYYLSDNQFIRVGDQQIFLSSSATVAAGQEVTFNDRVVIPTFTSTRSLYLGVLVDLYSQVPEANRTNNVGVIQPAMRVVFPIPDLAGQIVESATVAAAGESYAVTRILLNDGVAPAPQFQYTYYLSSNPTIATDDIAIGTFTGALGIGESDFGIDVLNVPSNVPEGNYFLGLILDPAGLLVETERNNNFILGGQVRVFRSAIQFITDNLPRGTLGVPYEVGVYARGGPLPITWSVASGALPNGMSIGQTSGIISGTPTLEGLYQFVLRASSGTASASKAFSIRVTAPTVDLRVATSALPTAMAGRSYQTQLIAVGGQIPYEWSALSAPPGLTLRADGSLTGTPEAAGGQTITVRVRDGLGNSASKDLTLNVINPNQSIQISQIPLPSAIVGMPYCTDSDGFRFEAQNGIQPYTWSWAADAPAGMTLSEAGQLCGTPERVGVFPVQVRVQDATGMFDTSLFLLEVEDGRTFAIATFSLEDGMVGRDYGVQISAIRGSEPYSFGTVAGAGDLPPGLTLSESGRISGQPTQAGTFAFVVRATDDAGRLDVQPLSVTVAPAPIVVTPEPEGCSCSASAEGPSSPWAGLALLLVGGFLVRRRR